MKIAIIGKLFAPIRTSSSMGQEKFTYNLAHLLGKKGHQVTLFTSGDSKVEGVKISSVVKESLWTAFNKNPQKLITADSCWKDVRRRTLGYFNMLYYLRNHKNDFDIVHDNSCDYEIIGLFQFLVNLPLISTIHVPARHLENLNQIVGKELDNYYIAISKKQKKLIKKTRVFDVVYNGIDVRKFGFSENSKEHLSWVGRIDSIKGVDVAIEVAEKTHSRLKIAGPIFDQKFFDEKIRPKLNKEIRYLGELSGRKLTNFYKQSKAILFPIKWEEPFGLVMVESMACGTPIIAFRRGSVPEIVVHGKTGFICPRDKVHSMVEAVKKLYNMSDRRYKNIRINCRQHVEENFTLEKMVDNYEKVYGRVLADWKEKHR